jgi:hypothetical protein
MLKSSAVKLFHLVIQNRGKREITIRAEFNEALSQNQRLLRLDRSNEYVKSLKSKSKINDVSATTTAMRGRDRDEPRVRCLLFLIGNGIGDCEITIVPIG